MTTTNPIMDQAEADMDRVIQLAEQAVMDNHNSMTQGGKRLGINGHDFASHGLCAHPDCYLIRTLRFTAKQLKNRERDEARDAAALAATVAGVPI